MKKITPALRLQTRTVCFLSCALLILSSGCRKIDQHNPVLKHFAQVNLVDNNGKYQALHMDPKQINSWGIAFSPNGIAWVNSEGGHVSALYDKDGASLRPPINIPSPMDFASGHPTGIVFNGTSDFVIAKGGPARFMFVGVDGILSGWNGEYGGTAGRIKINSATAAYTGLTMAKVGDANFLYAADFRANKITVWDKNFTPVTMSFKDPEIPAGYAPFNIQSVGEWLYVMYAKVSEEDGEEEPGAGLGYVSIFKPNGDFVGRFASKGPLNAPWGVAWAPAAFFNDLDEEWDNEAKGGNHLKDMNLILIGNFGDGRINAYTEDGFFLGALKSRGKPIEIEGLWAITFPPATATSIDPNRLYFAAGPDDEKDGLFGYIIKK